MTLPVKAQGLDLNVSIDLVFVRGRPRAVAEPVRERARAVDEALRDQLTAASVDRLAAVPG